MLVDVYFGEYGISVGRSEEDVWDKSLLGQLVEYDPEKPQLALFRGKGHL